jgi:hypothetical protein
LGFPLISGFPEIGESEVVSKKMPHKNMEHNKDT